MFICLDCYPDKYNIPGIDTYITNVAKQAPDWKDDVGSKKTTSTIYIIERNKEYNGEDGKYQKRN